MASGEMTAEELAAFRHWRSASAEHNAAFEQERALWRALQISPAQDRTLRTHWARLGRKRKLRTALVSCTAAAAAVGMLLYAPALELWIKADQWTGISPQTITLTDGSRAILDGDSAISIHYSETGRDIALLRGNALFEVRHDAARPFRVTAQDGMVEDVGTVFDVQKNTDHVRVTVSQGLVDVHGSATTGSALRLGAGERTSYAHGHTSAIERGISPDDLAPWAHGDLMLDNATLPDAIRQISRYRRGAVYVWGNVTRANRISGAFRVDRPDEALSTIAATAGLSILKLPGHIMILKKSG